MSSGKPYRRQTGPTDSTSASLRNFAAAVALHRQGRLIEAALLYEGVLRADHDHFDALSNLALLRLQQGQANETVRLARRALYRQPRSPELLNTLGLALHAQGHSDDAVVSYRKAVVAKPDFADAYVNLGAALRSLTRDDEAIACYEKAIAIRPDFAAAHNNLGNVYRGLNRYDEAMRSYTRAIALQPDYGEAYNNMGGALQEVGRLDEALAVFERGLALAPRKAALYLGLSDCKRFQPNDPHLAAMIALANDAAALSPEERMPLHFALGKAFGDLDDHGPSSKHLLAGNILKRQRTAYDEAATLELLDRVRHVFTAELIRSRIDRGDPSAGPVFILGMPRSGTSLVEQILASHPNVYGAGEIEAFGKAVAGLSGSKPSAPFPENLPAPPDKMLDELGRRYVAGTRSLAPEAERITDKMPDNFRFVGLIHLALPNARIIHTLRDPVDTCLSCFSKLFVGDQPWSYELGEIGRYYRAYERLMEHWRQVLPPGVMLEVEYERIIQDLEGESRRIIAHVGLEWDDACLAFHQTKRPVRTASASQVREPIYRNAVGRWRPYAAMLSPLLEALGRAPVTTAEAMR